mmetsp:Transcript_14099/g.38601  ORF Transcript_14099/g.38601 Transcript_14099/m.38601 type:complete len:172 (+) Transcript_14099:185-700(+)|eukprot:CAMPEP_0117505392 /NCGR_PEP_ID=MMETSP0784-20121206/25354_1 /TAXON_ID=39447 /ORGANISM="" /LENGTH=171 /DNA_ID=CAMNT_0005300803 /DNA_START=181 /DNA_END=696 /DNA_ORIENTATION=-
MSRAENVKAVFKQFDSNNDGVINASELKELFAVLGENMSDVEVAALVKAFDKNGDGILNYDEFIEWVMLDELTTGCNLTDELAASCEIGGIGPFTLTVNKITKGGTEQVTIDVSPHDNVGAVTEKLEPDFEADLRFHDEFDNLQKDLSLLDVGISQAMEVDLQISCMARGP